MWQAALWCQLQLFYKKKILSLWQHCISVFLPPPAKCDFNVCIRAIPHTHTYIHTHTRCTLLLHFPTLCCSCFGHCFSLFQKICYTSAAPPKVQPRVTSNFFYFQFFWLNFLSFAWFRLRFVLLQRISLWKYFTLYKGGLRSLPLSTFFFKITNLFCTIFAEYFVALKTTFQHTRVLCIVIAVFLEFISKIIWRNAYDFIISERM